MQQRTRAYDETLEDILEPLEIEGTANPAFFLELDDFSDHMFHLSEGKLIDLEQPPSFSKQ